MSTCVQPLRFERRWPVVLTIAAVLALLMMMPGRIRLVPLWVSLLMGLIVLVPICIVGITRASARWARAEYMAIFGFFIFASIGTIVNLANIIVAISDPSDGVTGQQLLLSSIAVWTTNVLAFSLFYWQLDRGGPEARCSASKTLPDWSFPQSAIPDQMPSGWHPVFIDYLYLSYSTATAFSTTDVVPLTSRAKLLMMLESAISLVIILVVAARAINILGS